MAAPAVRQNWVFGEGAKGSVAKNDPGTVEDTFVASEDGIIFGRFVARGVTNKMVNVVADTDTEIEGIALIANNAGDYANEKFLAEDLVPVAKKGTFFVEIDPADKPSVNGPVLIDTSTDKEGLLVGTPAAGVTLVAQANEMRIVAVYDNVAAVEIADSTVFTVAASV